MNIATENYGITQMFDAFVKNSKEFEQQFAPF